MMRAAVVALVMWGCIPARSQPVPTAYTPGMRIAAQPVYQQWFVEVLRCAAWVRQTDSSFVLRDTVPHVRLIRWEAVPTESARGAFPCTRRVGMCWGETFDGDSLNPTIRLSAQYLLFKPLVKHELLHVAVISPGENNMIGHGVPWGICEWQ